MRHTTRIVLLVALAALALSLVGCAAANKAAETAYPSPATADPAKATVCLSNQQVFESQVAQWSAASAGEPMPATLDALVAAGAVDKVPSCPNGGSYAWDPAAGTITCSVDGHWK